MNKLTTAQLFTIMFLSRIFVTLMYTPNPKNSEYVSDFLIQILVATLFNLVTIIPVFLLVRDKNREGLFEDLSRNGPVQRACAAILIVCLFFAAIRVLVRFNIFATTVMFPGTDFRFFLVLMILCGLYCTKLGLGTLGRTAEIFAPVVIISVLVVLVSTAPKLEFTNFTPLLYGGVSGPLKNAIFSASANVELVLPLLFKSKVDGDLKRCIFPYLFSVMGTVFLLMLFLAGVLGDYALAQLFPFFSLTSMTSFGFIERLDALLTSAWVISVFVKVTVLLYSAGLCVKVVFPKLKKTRADAICAAVLSVFVLFMSETYALKTFLLNITSVFVMYLIAVVIVPTIALFISGNKDKNKSNNKYKNKKNESENKALMEKKLSGESNKFLAFKRRLFALILSVLMLFSFSGCLNSEPEIKNITVIQGIGIDYDRETGEYLTTVEIFNMSKSSGVGELEAGNLTKIVTGRGENVLSAMNDITLEIGKPLIFSQKRAVIISKDALKPGLSNALDFFVRDYKTRLSMPLAISDGCKASDIIKADEGEVAIPSRELQTLLRAGKVNGYTTDVVVGTVDSQSQEKTTSYIPLVKVKKEGKDKYTQLNGFALIKDNKYVGDLSLTEGRGLLFANDKIEGGSFNTKDDKNGTATLNIVSSNTKIKTLVDQKNNKVRFLINIKTTVDVNEIQRKRPNDGKSIYPKEIQGAAEEHIRRITELALVKCLDEYGADVFGLGRRVFILHPEFYRTQTADGSMNITSANVEIHVDVKLRRLGQGDA